MDSTTITCHVVPIAGRTFGPTFHIGARPIPT
jgi:hypothetical protein